MTIKIKNQKQLDSLQQAIRGLLNLGSTMDQDRELHISQNADGELVVSRVVGEWQVIERVEQAVIVTKDGTIII